MTNHAPESRSRKRLVLLSITGVVILTAAWIASFLISFDLNDYRQQAEARLSSLLSMPVRIGSVDYHFLDTNLALHVTELQIGDINSAVQIQAPNVMINLQWWGLLSRDFTFTKISLLQPLILGRVPISEQSNDSSPRATPAHGLIGQALLQNISIRALEILDGVVQIEVPDRDQTIRKIDISAFDGELSDVGLNQASKLIMKGDLAIPGQEEKSPWQFQGQSTLELDKSSGLVPHFNFDLQVKDLALDAVRALFPDLFASCSITGSSDISLHIEGIPGALDFQTSLSSRRIALLPSPGYTKPILFKSLLISGQLHRPGDHPGISNLSLQIDESRLAGDIAWVPQGQPFSATVTILSSAVKVSQVRKWLPETPGKWQEIRQGLLEQGSILIDRAEFALFEAADTRKTWQVNLLKGELLQLAWSNSKTPKAEIMSLPFSFTGKHWQISKGLGQWGSLQLAVNGTGEYDEDGIVLTALDFTGEALPDKLMAEWHMPQSFLQTEGKINLSGHLEGPIDQLRVDLQADLSEFSLSHRADLRLAPGANDNLSLQGTVSAGKVSLDHGAFRWSVASGHLSGSYLTKDPDSLAIDASLSVDNLAELARTLPRLDKLQLRGQADLTIHQRGRPENHPPEMVLTLRDAGLRATRHIADLSQINGRVRLTSTGLVADDLRVHLGQAPLKVQVQVADFSNPSLVLDVKAPSIRADELVFSSDKTILHNIEGHLVIDGDELTFAPVDVDLDGGTKASVRGTISFHPPFNVELDITSEFARISEVVALWSNQSEISKKRSAAIREAAEDTRSQATVKINATVKKGDLYGMSFHDASGVIVPTHGHMVIHPLDFSVGEGFCNAQVITDFSPDKPTLLRISGHAEDVDALEVYRELLGQKSIVRGKLRGDFYLSGEIGPKYLPSSYGNFNIQIQDGVLHQFPVLSKVFSLLNVSQIFAFHLPNMNLDGMPFETLTANLQLDKGVLKSEDLRIKSDAMNQSYSGELNLINKQTNFVITIHPLGTVDKIVSSIPVAGWLLTGQDKALLSTSFAVKGKVDDVSVYIIPLETLTEPTIGLLKRTLGLPFKLFEDPQILWGGEVGEE